MEKSVEPEGEKAQKPACQPRNGGVREQTGQARGLSVQWFAAGGEAPVNVARFPPQTPKHNAKSDRLYLEAEPPAPGASAPGAADKKFYPPAVGDLRVALHGESVHEISYALPAPAPPENGGKLGRGPETWVQLNEPKSEYVVQLKLAPEPTRPVWALARMLVYVPTTVALELWPRGPDSVRAGWRPGEPVTISAILGI
jgi:hypothetical protein